MTGIKFNIYHFCSGRFNVVSVQEGAKTECYMEFPELFVCAVMGYRVNRGKATHPASLLYNCRMVQEMAKTKRLQTQMATGSTIHKFSASSFSGWREIHF